MFIEVTPKNIGVNEKWVVNVYSIAVIHPNPEDNSTRIYFVNNCPHLDIKESYEDVKKGLEIVVRQMSKRQVINLERYSK